MVDHCAAFPGTLPVIVRQNQYSAPPLVPGLLQEILGGIVHACQQVRSSTEFSAQNSFVDGSLHCSQVFCEWRYDLRGPVKRHDGNSIASMQFGQRRVSGDSYPFHFWTHAAADIEQEDQIQRHLFLRKIKYVPRLAVIFDGEILFVKSV